MPILFAPSFTAARHHNLPLLSSPLLPSSALLAHRRISVQQILGVLYLLPLVQYHHPPGPHVTTYPHKDFYIPFTEHPSFYTTRPSGKSS
eukprot:757606-Hanusia_phi.AAC.3